jgi:hypothetical protein
VALLRRRQPLRVETVAEAVKRLALLLALVVGLGAAVPAGGAVSDTWRPNYRIGAVQFNYPPPVPVEQGGGFATEPPIVRGVVSEDPNTGRRGVRAVWTRSKRIVFRGVRVGTHWRTAKRRLPGRWTVRRGVGCGWLNSSRLRTDRTGPVSTQLFFRRGSGRIFEIALNEITEIGCPRA